MKLSPPQTVHLPSTPQRETAFERARRKTLLLGLFILVLLVGGVGKVRSQSARDGFDPNANGGVDVVAAQLDGKVIVAGSFTSLAPNGGAAVTRYRIARLNPDGSLDVAFNPNANGAVYALSVQPDGSILVGGDFTRIGGQARTNLARLDGTTGLADPFDPHATGGAVPFVNSVAVQADGKIVVGGAFTTLAPSGGPPVMRNRLARLDGTSGTPDSFNPNANNQIRCLAIQADGKILAGGAFTAIGGRSRQGFVRLDPIGSHCTLAGLHLPGGPNLYIRARGYFRSGIFNGSESIEESVRMIVNLPPVLKVLSITRSGNGHILLQCLGFPNKVNDLQASPDLSPGSFLSLVPAPPGADDAGVFSYDDAAATDLTERFYRLAP